MSQNKLSIKSWSVCVLQSDGGKAALTCLVRIEACEGGKNEVERRLSSAIIIINKGKTSGLSSLQKTWLEDLWAPSFIGLSPKNISTLDCAFKGTACKSGQHLMVEKEPGYKSIPMYLSSLAVRCTDSDWS